MFCKRCGQQLPDGARFCPGCGLDLSGLSSPSVRQEARPEPKAEARPEPKSDPRREPGKEPRETPQKEPGKERRKEPKARKFTPPSFRRSAAGGSAAGERAAGKRFSPKWIIPILAAAVCAVAVGLPFLQNRTVERFPDPAAFFGQEAKSVDRRDDCVIYTFLFDGDPAPMVAAYEELVNSNGHNVYLLKQIGDETDHDYLCSTTEFLYLGSAPSWQGWTSKNALLIDDWLLDSGSHAVEVTLYNPNHFEFTPQDRYRGPALSAPSSGAAEPVPVQEPAPGEAAPAETAPAEEPAPPAVDLSVPTLPDIESFSGGALAPIKETVFLDHTKRSYSINYNEKFVREYVDLLENYGFTLKSAVENDTRSIYYLFDYTGPGTVETFHPDVKKIKDESVAVYIWDNRGYEIQIYYADGITYADTGERTTQSLTPYEGSASSGGSSSIDWGDSSSPDRSVPKIRCTKCHGEKEVDCPECRGRGTLANYGATPNYSGSGRTTYSDPKDCLNCVGGKITCPRCNGTGWE